MYIFSEEGIDNSPYWNDSNSHLFREVHTQLPQKLNVWCGILKNHIVEPHSIPGNLTDEVDLNMLEGIIDPLITETIEDDQNHNTERFRFQQDGAPPHYVVAVREFLNNQFPGRWRGPIECPSRSPDMSPLDYFL